MYYLVDYGGWIWHTGTYKECEEYQTGLMHQMPESDYERQDFNIVEANV